MPFNNNNKSSSSNPNPRNSEISNPMRRSFSGNPFSKPSSLITNPRSSFSHTPANTPSDFSRKSLDDKENGKDQILKHVKVRSPAATSKTTKHFMSPTISATFRVAESPRKKILADRNEAAPFSDPKVHVRKVTFADPLEQKRLDASLDGSEIPFPSFDDSLGDDLLFDSMHMNVPFIPHNDIHTETSFENVSHEPDFVNLDPTFKLSPAAATPPVSNTATIIDPLDTDPSIPPYDSKTNYLSPRPQFLHYKPKPRMELCSQKEMEDSLMSASLSDTEVTEDTQSDESHSSDEIEKQEEDRVFEQSPARTLLAEETVEAKESQKQGFSLRSKAVALILLMSIAFVSISITNSPGIDRVVFEDFYEAYGLSEFSEIARANFDQFSQLAKANFNGLAGNLHIWFTKALSSISELISDVRGARHLSQMQYFNLTVLQEHVVGNQYPIFDRENEIVDTHPSVEEKYTASEIAMYEYFGDISLEHYELYEEQLQHDMEVAKAFDVSVDVEEALESEEPLESQSVTSIEPEPALQQVEAANEEDQTPSEYDSEYKSSSNLEDAEIHNEVCAEGNVDTMLAQENEVKLNDKESDADRKHSPDSTSGVPEIHPDEKAVGNLENTDAAIRENEQQLQATNIPSHMVLYLLLCAGTVVIAGATFNWSRKGKSRSKKFTSSVKKSEIGSENKRVSPDKQPSVRTAPVEMDMVGESCPSYSSFEKSSSYRVNQLNEAISLEKKRRNNNRRESLASSSDYSMGSPSYGSLTVYEKIVKGRGEEEIVTPVRRSSRIRSLVTSPV